MSKSGAGTFLLFVIGSNRSCHVALLLCKLLMYLPDAPGMLCWVVVGGCCRETGAYEAMFARSCGHLSCVRALDRYPWVIIANHTRTRHACDNQACRQQAETELRLRADGVLLQTDQTPHRSASAWRHQLYDSCSSWWTEQVRMTSHPLDELASSGGASGGRTSNDVMAAISVNRCRA